MPWIFPEIHPFLARHGGSEGDPLVGALGAIVILILGVFLLFRELGANYNVVIKNGAPYCPRCGRQVSYRRDHCRCCGHMFKTYGPPPKSKLEVERERVEEADFSRRLAVREQREGELRRLQARERAAGRALRRAVRNAWYRNRGIVPTRYAALQLLPAWLQPIIWGSFVSATVLCFALAAFLPATSGTRVLLASLGLAGSVLTFGVLREGLSLVPDPLLKERDPRVPEFARLIAERLKTTPARGFDLGRLASEAGIQDERTVESATIEVYARYALTIVADGVITPAERRKIDSLASLLVLPSDQATKIEEAARKSRYESALKEVFADGIVTPEEAAMLHDLRDSLGLPDAQVVAAD